MPFNPNNFSYRDTFKDDSVLSAIDVPPSWASYDSSEVGIALLWLQTIVGGRAVNVARGWFWQRAGASGPPRDLITWRPGVLSTRASVGSGPAPVLGLSDPLWVSPGDARAADYVIDLDPVPTWRSTKGLAIMGVTHGIGTLSLVVPGGVIPTLASEKRREGDVLPGWVPVVSLTGAGYLRIQIDTHKMTCKRSIADSENGPATWHDEFALAPGVRDVPVWPIWDVQGEAVGPSADAPRPSLPPAGRMSLRLPSGAPLTHTLPGDTSPSPVTYKVDSVGTGGGSIGFVNVDAFVHARGTDFHLPPYGVGPPALGVLTPVVAVGDIVSPGDVLATFDYESGGAAYDGLWPPPAAGRYVDLNLLVWRNVGGAMTVGDPVRAVLPHKQPVAAAPPPQDPTMFEIPPLSVVPPAGGLGSLAPDPSGGGPIGHQGVLPV